MKKVVCGLFCIVIALSLTACIAKDVPVKETEKGGQASETRSEETFGLNETAAFTDLKFTATQMVESDGDDFFTPDNGNVFVGIKFTVENISDEPQTVSSLLLFEGYADDVKCSYSFSAACAFDGGTLDGEVAAGKKLVGWYALEVPKDWACIELQVQSSVFSNNPAKFVFSK